MQIINNIQIVCSICGANIPTEVGVGFEPVRRLYILRVMPCPKCKNKILDLITKWGGIDGGHHKQWVLDQILTELTGDEYPEWVAKYEDGEDGPGTYEWDKGIAP